MGMFNLTLNPPSQQNSILSNSSFNRLSSAARSDHQAARSAGSSFRTCTARRAPSSLKRTISRSSASASSSVRWSSSLSTRPRRGRQKSNGDEEEDSRLSSIVDLSGLRIIWITVQFGGSFEISEERVLKADNETAAAACRSSKADQYETTASETASGSKLEEADEREEVGCPRIGRREPTFNFGPEAGSGGRGEGVESFNIGHRRSSVLFVSGNLCRTASSISRWRVTADDASMRSQSHN